MSASSKGASGLMAFNRTIVELKPLQEVTGKTHFQDF